MWTSAERARASLMWLAITSAARLATALAVRCDGHDRSGHDRLLCGGSGILAHRERRLVRRELGVGADDVHDGVDEREVRERLREVPEVAPGSRVDLLRVEQQRAREAQHPLAQLAGQRRLADLGERAHEPERADRERPLLAGQAVVGLLDLVAQHEAVDGQLVGDGHHGRADARRPRAAGTARAAAAGARRRAPWSRSAARRRRARRRRARGRRRGSRPRRPASARPGRARRASAPGARRGRRPPST